MHNDVFRCGDIIFCTGKNNIMSKLIKFFTKSNYTHCAIVLDNKHLYHINYNQPANITHIIYPKEEYEVYRPKDKFNHDKFHDFISSNIGNKYDLIEILEIIFNKDKKDKSYNYICSSLIYEAFKYSGLELCDKSYALTPFDLIKSGKLRRIK